MTEYVQWNTFFSYYSLGDIDMETYDNKTDCSKRTDNFLSN